MLINTPLPGSFRKKATQPQQLPPTDPKVQKQIRKAEKAEREFRKKFKVRTWGREWVLGRLVPRPRTSIPRKKPRNSRS